MKILFCKEDKVLIHDVGLLKRIVLQNYSLGQRGQVSKKKKKKISIDSWRVITVISERSKADGSKELNQRGERSRALHIL